MNEKRKRRLKKFYFHPTTTFLLLTIFVVVLSWFLAKVLNIQSSYSIVNPNTLELETVIVKVNNLLSADGVKLIFGSAATNLASFSAFINLIVALIGLSVAHASGFIKAFIQRNTLNLNNKVITFVIILLGIFSSLVNDVGYVVLIPLSALVFAANRRSPLLGITTAFCGVSFGYAVSLFTGSLDVALVKQTELASYLVDTTYHVALLSNIFIMIVSSIILAIVGTIAIETVVVKKIGKYKSEELENTIDVTDLVSLDDKEKIEMEYLTKRGLRNAYIVGILMLIIYVYMIIPGLPNSGLLLDMNEYAYVNQLFGENSYFQSGFTYLVSILFLAVGIAYAIGAKTLKNDKELIEKVSVFFKDIGGLIVTMFFFVQFIVVFKKTNIGIIISCIGADFINNLSLTGIILILVSLLVMSFSGIFLTSTISKWTIFSPVVVPLMMQSNISPEFAQFVLRAADSMTKGITPFLAYFIIYLGYLNIYNKKKEPITIRKALSFVFPYFSFMVVAWIVIVIGWYLIGLPLGPNAMPTL